MAPSRRARVLHIEFLITRECAHGDTEGTRICGADSRTRTCILRNNRVAGTDTGRLSGGAPITTSRNYEHKKNSGYQEGSDNRNYEWKTKKPRNRSYEIIDYGIICTF